MKLLIHSLALLGVAGATASAAQAPSTPIVTAPAGKLQGVVEGGVQVF